MPSEDRSAFLSVDSLSQGADSLSKKAQYGAAQPLYQKALAIRRKVLGEDHPNTATSYNNLAAILNAQGQYGSGPALYQKSLDISRQVLGEDHPNRCLLL